MPRPTRLAFGLLLGLAAPALAAPPAKPATAAPATKAAPEKRQAGLDLEARDTSVQPGDDFFDYANGSWVRKTEIPSDRASWGAFAELSELSTQRTRALIEDLSHRKAPKGSEAQKIGDYYASFMDEAGIEKRGTQPLKPTLEAIQKISDKTALARYVGSHLRADVDPLNMTHFHTPRLFGLWVSLELSHPDRYVPYLLQGGVGMPDRDYYLIENPRMAGIREAYQKHIATLLSLAGEPDAEAKAARVMALETKIAKAHVARVESEDVLKANNPWKRAEFAKRAPGFDWAAFFQAAGLAKQDHLIVWQPSAVTGEAALVASEPLEAWKDWLTFHAIDSHAGVLPKAFVDESFAFYGKTLSGTPELSARWKRGVSATNGALGFAVGHLYVKRYFPPAAKKKAQEMVQNIVAAFGRRIDGLTWMAPATKAKAKEKLKTLYVGIGYPERWRSYAGLRVVRGDAYGNAERAGIFEYHRNLKKLGHKVDRTEWSLLPQTVNAVNMPLQNALDFPAAILEPPFFDAAATMAQNYGGIGSTIGHEISHSFDDQGSQFDAHGRLSDWWTPADLKHFREASARLAAQFDAYKPFPDTSVNGKLTLSENIADVAGISAAFDGYHASLHGKPDVTAQGLTGDQRFFLSFGQVWQSKVREPALRQQLLTDGHAPAMFRADTVRNLDAWYPAFDVKPGQKLYLAPETRVRVW